MRPRRHIPLPLPGISTAWGNGNAEVYLMTPVPNAWPSNASYTKPSICVIVLIVGGPLSAMGHNVQSTGGSIVGGFQSIMMVPGPNVGTPGRSRGGYYRAGSDHRKDGQAVGW
jgi:hypothetical protein